MELEYLIFSDDIGEIKDGIYILDEMIKVAKSENESYIVKNVEELFFFKLLDFADPLKDKCISQYYIENFRIILEPNVFFNICISVLIKVIEDISIIHIGFNLNKKRRINYFQIDQIIYCQ
jgi:hypothetical protein